MAMKTQLEPRGGRPTAGEENAFRAILDAISRWENALRRVTVRSDDVLDATGRTEHVFRVHVTFSGRNGDAPSMLVEGRGYQEQAAAARAASAAASAIARILERERKMGAAEPSPDVVRTPHRTPRERKTARPARGRGIHKTSIEASVTRASEASDPHKRPSRKSTRRSVNRAKPDAQQRGKAVRASRSPKSRATTHRV
jgi:hypothetical protein